MIFSKSQTLPCLYDASEKTVSANENPFQLSSTNHNPEHHDYVKYYRNRSQALTNGQVWKSLLSTGIMDMSDVNKCRSNKCRMVK